MPKVQYLAVCLVCYSGNAGPMRTSRKAAETDATGHMNAYGHDVRVTAQS